MHRILFIHPDSKLTEIYHPRLATHFLLDSAHEGLSGLRKIKINRPDVIISDYNLPLLSGPALLKYIRGHNQFSVLPFIFLTSHPDAHDALGLGASDWLDQKSTTPEILIGKIYQQLKINHSILKKAAFYGL
jgi:CheY-like chemotaxis protein